MTKQDASTGVKVLGYSLGGVMIGLALAGIALWCGFWNSLALSVLWGWFAAPLFGLPDLSMLQAYGVILVATCIRGLHAEKPTRHGVEYITYLALHYPFGCGLVLLFGWIVKGMM